MSCCATMTMKLPWPASLIDPHGTTCLTWWARRTQPLSHSNKDISIAMMTPLRLSVTTVRRGSHQGKATMRRQLISMPARGPRSSGASGCLAFLHDLNGHGGGNRTVFQFSYHAARNHVMETFRPGLKVSTGWMTMMQALSLLLDWPEWEALLPGGATHATCPHPKPGGIQYRASSWTAIWPPPLTW